MIDLKARLFEDFLGICDGLGSTNLKLNKVFEKKEVKQISNKMKKLKLLIFPCQIRIKKYRTVIVRIQLLLYCDDDHYFAKAR